MLGHIRGVLVTLEIDVHDVDLAPLAPNLDAPGGEPSFDIHPLAGRDIVRFGGHAIPTMGEGLDLVGVGDTHFTTLIEISMRFSSPGFNENPVAA
jgi:hypothetical protein